jgi:nucleotide-binding universal stress UspA family protein
MLKILIPTDFSANAWNAIEYTMACFERVPVHVHLLHITHNLEVASVADVHAQGLSLMPTQVDDPQSQLAHLKQKIETLFPRGRFVIESAVRNSFFVEGIKKAVWGNDIDLIVMGTKGASGLKEKTIGSHTGAVITRVKCPVLVVPEDAEFIKPKNIVLPSDYNILYKQRVLETLLQFANLHQASIKVLRVASDHYSLNAEQERNRDFLIDALQPVNHSFHWIKNPDLEEGLQSFIDIMDVQVIAMVAKNLNFFQRLLFKPVAARISYHTEIPFLVLHE